MVLDPVFFLRGGRRLPIPPPSDHLDGFLQRAGAIHQLTWPIPSFSTAQQLTCGSSSSSAPCVPGDRGALASASGPDGVPRPRAGDGRRVQRRAHTPGHPAGRLRPLRVGQLRAVRLLADRGRRGPPGVGRASSPRAVVLAAAACCSSWAAIPHFTARTYTDYSLQSFGFHRIAYKIEHNGRSFYYGRPKTCPPRPSCSPTRTASRSPATDSSWARPTCARRRTATRTSTTCCPS